MCQDLFIMFAHVGLMGPKSEEQFEALQNKICKWLKLSPRSLSSRSRTQDILGWNIGELMTLRK